jgi:hypothetical protein
MACSTISGLTYSLCANNMGGVKSILLCNREDVTSIQTGTDASITGTCITGITMASGKTFQEFTIRKNTCNMASTLQVGDGSTYVSTELSIVLRRMDSAKRMAMNALILGECYAIVVDANNIAWLLGFDEAVTCTAGGAETGTAKGDVNQYTLTLTDESLEYPYEINASALASATGKA